jgi:hypothetical protein
MSTTLKLKKEIKGNALIDLGPRGSLGFDEINVSINDWSEREMVLLVVDKKDPNNKIQLCFDKPEEFIEKKTERIEYIRKQAQNALALTNGFTPEQRKDFSESIKTTEEFANFILELTNK